jgi:UDP-N-acetylmuramoyl-tripeptide--D-alanyl-D-alanine ligase
MARQLSLEDRRRYLNLRRNFKSPVIGVTGNVGKTTTIAMIRTILEQKGKVLSHHHGYGNWNNNISTLEKLSSEYDYAIFEFDFHRSNNFAEILRIIKPNIGIVTNIGDAHLSYIGGMLDVALKRSEVVKFLTRDGVAILNKDDELCSAVGEHISSKNIIKFGLSKDSDYYASNIEHLGPQGTRFLLNDKFTVTIPVYSIRDVYNFLAAVAALVALDIPLKFILETFQTNYQLPNGRGKIYKLNGNYVIDESYEATPRSVAKAARSIVGFKSYADRLIYIIGDMIELGVNIEEQHLNMGYFLSALPIDYFITVGHYAEFIGKGISLIQSKEKMVISCTSVDDILNTLEQIITKKSVITVQGIGQVGLRRLLNYLEKKN